MILINNNGKKYQERKNHYKIILCILINKIEENRVLSMIILSIMIEKCIIGRIRMYVL